MIYQWGNFSNCSTIHFVYQTLFTASKLKVFDVLNSSENLTLEEVAGQINASVLGTERLLEAAVSLGLLERVKQRDTSGKIYVLPFYTYRWCCCRRNHMWVLKPIKNHCPFIAYKYFLCSLNQGTCMHGCISSYCMMHVLFIVMSGGGLWM